jgi:glyoxylase-like metal-dependent hydrolase (beta-lactamase superfamily II)
MPVVRLYALTCGWLTGPAGGFLAGEEGELRVPVPAFLVVHGKGKALFDSGLHPQTQTDPAARLGIKARVFGVHYRAGEDVVSRLETAGFGAGDIHYLVNSHLHFDHTGGNALLPNATVIVQRREWEAGLDPELAAANHYDEHDYRTGQDVRLIDGEHDLFGDGSVVCVPTYGHTPGHQSLRVELESGPVILTADACYLRRTLEQLHLPGVVHDQAAMLASLRELRRLQSAGARIFYGHDPEFWRGVPQGMAL